MSLTLWGVLLGGGVGAGVVLVIARVRAIRRPALAMRVLPYLRDLPSPIGREAWAHAHTGPGRRSASRVLHRVADLLGRTLGGAASIQRRLDRAGIDRSAADFRVEQVLWALTAFALAAACGVLQQVRHHGPGRAGTALASLGVCAAAFVAGVVARDSRLSQQVRERERRIVVEFPPVAELLALAVAAGESPVAALDRVVARSRGPLRDELGRTLAEIRAGAPVASAFDALASRSGLPVLARFAGGVATAAERGTPLADVLHAQAADVREAGRRELIETAARREVFMMAPVVLLVLPAVVLVVLFPGLLDLHLSAG